MRKLIATLVLVLLAAMVEEINLQYREINELRHAVEKLDSTTQITTTIQRVMDSVVEISQIYNVPGTHIPQVSTGTGYFIAPGYIVTCYHTIQHTQDPDNWVIILRDELTVVEVEDYLFDEDLDVAVLKVDNTDVPFLRFSDVSKLVEGTPVWTCGHPGNNKYVVSKGIISQIKNFSYMKIDAPISPGSSGGPVVDSCGRVIGQIYAFDTRGEDLSCAIRGDKLQRVVCGMIEVLSD